MIDRIQVQVVTTIPSDPLPGVLYVSIEYATTLHLCACGCEHEVVLGISPKDWQLCWDGETITLDPSVGNWSFPCQSHYLIRHNRILRAGRWDEEQIARGRAADAQRKRPQQSRLRVLWGRAAAGKGCAAGSDGSRAADRHMPARITAGPTSIRAGTTTSTVSRSPRSRHLRVR
jgi:hypothetical protein